MVLPDSEFNSYPIYASMLSNSTAVSQVFSVLENKFDKLYSKRAYVHWFTSEGKEEGEFDDAREDLAALLTDY